MPAKCPIERTYPDDIAGTYRNQPCPTLEYWWFDCGDCYGHRELFASTAQEAYGAILAHYELWHCRRMWECDECGHIAEGYYYGDRSETLCDLCEWGNYRWIKGSIDRGGGPKGTVTRNRDQDIAVFDEWGRGLPSNVL